MGIIEYFEFQQKYEKQYGERTIVLYQSGIFYETWEYDPNECRSDKDKIDSDGKMWTKHIGLSVILSTTLNYNLSCEDGQKPYGISNPHKMGFPIISYDKCLATLLANDYVVVRVDQQGSGKNITRSVAEIYSPTMQIDTISLNRSTSNIACIYIEYQKGNNNYENFLITTGVSVIDIITGQNKICEYFSKVEDEVHPLQELYRFLISHAPRELIIHLSDMPVGLDTNTDDKPNKYVKYLERVLELRRFDRLNVYINSVPVEYKKIAYQVEFLNKLFVQQESKKKSRLNIIQKRNDKIISELGMSEMNFGRISYLLLLQHCNSHNPATISKLSRPNLQWLDDKHHLILAHNAIVQLDLIPQKENKFRRKAEIDSLLSVLDHNRTHLGKRTLENLLQNPMLDPVEIQFYYDMVEEMFVMVDKDPLWLLLDKSLKELPDISRLQRKLELKLITPKELSMLYTAYIKIINIYCLILNNKVPVLQSKLLTQEEVTDFNEFVSRFGAIINFENLECCSVDTLPDSKEKILEFPICPTKHGVYPEIDELNNRLIVAETSLQQIVDHLNSFLGKTTGKKIKLNSAKAVKGQGAKKLGPDITILLTTFAKAKTLESSNVDVGLCGVLSFVTYSSSDKKIVSDKINYYCDEIDNVKMALRKQLYIIYETWIDEMVNTYTFYTGIAGLVAKVDLIHSYALVSHKYNYYKPTLDTSEGPSYFEIETLRHPVIERIIDGIYVTNDLSLGRGDTEKNRSNGMILYSLNMAGKSSLIKAVALNIILSQIGCFTACKLKYKPYSKIITRLSSQDNLFQGYSTFEIEMMELRTILRNSNENTLVLGNELAAGSDITCATGITASAILSLIDINATYIFASHIHDVVKLPHISKIPTEKLKVSHLTVTKDEKLNELIYERKLRNGQGPSVYGILVTEALGLPQNFINKAYEIVNYLLGTNNEVINLKTGRYNSSTYMDSCGICGKTQGVLHQHHLIEQKYADNKGLVSKMSISDAGDKEYIGSLHKNSPDNLIVLCQECHNELHSNHKELEILTVSTGKIIRFKL